MTDWIRAAEVANCPREGGIEVIARGQVIALFHVDGQWYALDGVCPHQGGPLANGQVAGCVVTCPWHGWQFDVRTGQHQINDQLSHPTYETRVEDGWIWVRIAQDAGNIAS